jgi:hypothetical protein
MQWMIVQEPTTRTPQISVSLHTWSFEEGRRMYATHRPVGAPGGSSNE